MKRPDITASITIKATTVQVHAVIADYRNGHPNILPKKYFSNLDVERGGFGAGTIIRFHMHAFGRSFNARASIMEPIVGRVLVETDLAAGHITTFTMQPMTNGRHTYVTISTELKSRGGLLGTLERFLVVRYLRRVYDAELQLLAEFVENNFRSEQPTVLVPKTSLHDSQLTNTF
jgi:hypothetical protein